MEKVKPLEEVWTDYNSGTSPGGMLVGYSTSNLGARREWTRLVDPLWITKSIQVRWNILGFDRVPIRKLEEFEMLAEEYLEQAVHYVVIAAGEDPDLPEIVINWVMGVMAEIAKETKTRFTYILPPNHLRIFLIAYKEKRFNQSAAKEAFREFVANNFQLEPILDRYKVMDAGAGEAIIDGVISANAEQWEKCKTDPKLVNWFTGQVMKAAKGKMQAPGVRESLLRRLA